jgi:hemerythrin superfamily protein
LITSLEVPENVGCGIISPCKKELKEIFERVLTWPEDRQENIARVLSDIEEYDATEFRRMDEQVA